MQLDGQQLSIILTLLQFVALAIPAVAMMMQVVLRFQDQKGDRAGIRIGLEFKLIEAAFFGLVLGGALISLPVVFSMDSLFAQLGTFLAIASLVALAVAVGTMLRRDEYPNQNFNSFEDAAKNFLYTVTGIAYMLVFFGGTMFLVSAATEYLFPDGIILEMQEQMRSQFKSINIPISDYQMIVLVVLIVVVFQAVLMWKWFVYEDI